jgi:hypothetical protein
MWASVTIMRTRQTNARTEKQPSQRGKFSEFARNWPRELIIIWSNRIARKCERAWYLYEQDKPMHVRRYRWVKDVSSPSSLGINPVSWFWSDQAEWQANVCKRGNHANKRKQCTYRAKVQSTRSVLWVRSEFTPRVDDFYLIKHNGKEMWASVTLRRTRQTNPRTEGQ